MVNHPPSPLDLTFAALADPSRRAMLARLANGDATVGELAQPFSMSPPAVTKHLDVLQRAGLITRERDGRMRRCHLKPERLSLAMGWIQDTRRFWDGQMDALARHLGEDHTPARAKSTPRKK